MLLDRLAERAALGRLLEAARGGQSGALVVRGEPGVGKTALLDDAIESAAGLPGPGKPSWTRSQTRPAHRCAVAGSGTSPSPCRRGISRHRPAHPVSAHHHRPAPVTFGAVVTAITGSKLLGDPVDRIDGPLKVTGAAPYPPDVTVFNPANPTQVILDAMGRPAHPDIRRDPPW
jgi:hypothetical protein